MKESMRKISLLVFYREKAEVVESLQDLGVFHLETADLPSEKAEALSKEKSSYETVLDLIKAGDDEGVADTEKPRDLDELRGIILKHRANIEIAEGENELLRKEKARLQPWGDFSWATVENLEKQGIQLKFFTAPLKEYRKYDFTGIYQFEIFTRKPDVFFVVVEKEGPVELPFDHVELPRKTVAEIDEAMARNRQVISENKRSINGYRDSIPALEAHLLKLEDQLNYEIAQHSFSDMAEGVIMHLQGWFPSGVETKVRSFLEEKNLSYIIEEPDRDDRVPVILKNRQYNKRFEPITRIFQLPDYYEFDLTPVIAVFYPIFFGYCLGDAGYGLVLIAVALIARSTILKNNRIFADLGMILGVVSAVLGIVKGGTFFGIPILEHQDVEVFGFLSRFVVVPEDPEFTYNTFSVALMIGLFQIILGVIIAIVRKIRYQSVVYAVSSFGKLLIIFGAVTLFLGKMQEMEAFMPYITPAWILLVGGVVLVLFFHDPSVPLLKRLGSGVLPVYFIFTGLLGDTLSYIRLFALGVASSILGLVVNQIGNQIMDDSVLSIAGGIVFLIFGHSLNLALASLGSFVHPLRLTFVEFYMNAEFKGGGIPYRPFRKRFVTENNIT
jgi:V/A-type H+-transporting ATPase subunit I